MNTISHLDTHPDVESLNAFAEHALPGHERETVFAHLAECTRCRQIVQLAVGAAEEVPSHVIAIERKPNPFARFVIWRMAPTGLAACAAIVTLILLRPRIDTPVHQATSKGTDASRHATRAPGEQIRFNPLPSTSIAKRDEDLQQQPAPFLSQSMLPRRAESKPSMQQSNGEQHVSHTVQPSPPDNTPAFSQSAVAAAPLIQPALPVTQDLAVTVSASSVFVSIQPERSAKELQLQAHVSSGQIPLLEAKTFNSAKILTPSHSIASAPHHNGVAGIIAAKSSPATNHVTNLPLSSELAISAPAPQHQPATKEDSELASRILYTRLPDGLTAVSTVSALHRLLALDTSGAVFRSEDSGATWTLIPQQWQSRALEVRIHASTADKSFPASSASTDQSKTDKAKLLVAAPSFEIVTADGSTWISTDGAVWTPGKAQ